MGQKLNPCPCCGGNAVYFDSKKTFELWDIVFHFTIMCRKCGLQLPDDKYVLRIGMAKNGDISIKKDDRQKAAEDWNRRMNDEIQK